MACQMVRNNRNILLGFQDEVITEKHKVLVDFATNKIGGKPDWYHFTKMLNPQCRLCGLNLPLLVQIYAPLEGSKYHRTLYIFACIQSTCWNRNESWLCIRQQSLCKTREEECGSVTESSSSASYWNVEANNWDSDDDVTPSVDQENGNIVVQRPTKNQRLQEDTDTDDSSISLDEPIDPNANSAGAEGAFALEFSNKVHIATAEIEIGDESDIVSIDTPTRIQPVSELFLQTNSKSWNIRHPEFVSSFISVAEEDIGRNKLKLSDHEMALLQQYQQSELGGGDITFDGRVMVVERGDGDLTAEQYEKEVPMHGDLFTHRFISRLQQTPGQILRYGWNSDPLLLHPLPKNDRGQCCQYCGGKLVFEMQLLPALLPLLTLTAKEGENGLGDASGILEFGTVLLYTCQDACWNPEDSSSREEKLIVQAETF